MTEVGGGVPDRWAAVRGRIPWHLTLLAVLLLALSGWWVLFGEPFADKAQSHPRPVTAVAVDEGTGDLLVGPRRSAHREERRTVIVEYRIAGETGTGRLYDDRLRVGDEVTVYVDPETGDVLRSEPSPIGFWDWAWLVVPGVVVVALAGGLVVGVVRTVRIATR